MKVKIKDFGLGLDVKNKGLVLDVYSTGPKPKHRGDLQVTKTGLKWCNGKKHDGPKISWDDFIEMMNTRAEAEGIA